MLVARSNCRVNDWNLLLTCERDDHSFHPAGRWLLVGWGDVTPVTWPAPGWSSLAQSAVMVVISRHHNAVASPTNSLQQDDVERRVRRRAVAGVLPVCHVTCTIAVVTTTIRLQFDGGSTTDCLSKIIIKVTLTQPAAFTLTFIYLGRGASGLMYRLNLDSLSERRQQQCQIYCSVTLHCDPDHCIYNIIAAY